MTVRPCDSCSTSAILAESYSFIWQPKVRMYSLLAIAGYRLRASSGVSTQIMRTLPCPSSS